MSVRARSLTVLVALLSSTSHGVAQTVEVSQTFVDLPAPNLAAYDAGQSLSAQLTISVTACGAPAGCEVTLDNPHVASAVPIALDWRVLDVSQLGKGDAGCGESAALLTWQPLASIPVPIMETGLVADGLVCLATIETRARDLAWSAHEFTSPASSYWREFVVRVTER